MVYIIGYADAASKIYEIRNSCENIIGDDVLGNKIIASDLNFFFKSFLIIAAFFKDFGKHSVRYLFVYAKRLAIKGDIFRNINHAV